ncbi:MAG: preprotein translocase subunit SecA [Chloroflexi bacterium]|uniref:Protein translocase subunit SecA n=1 Tax=Candidatus Chlorohelix allophototropha TaxID=3003348 RepID=A0A8T7M7Y1_9CHLR|nr:preprotein translocase subunit SecA [Chloroflexota bacterium]
MTGGDSTDKELRKLEQIASKVINEYDQEFSKLSDEELRAKTDQFKERLNNGESLEDILPEAFATVREAAWRTRRQKHFKVQIMGGQVLHSGKIAEMKTGEGKTLVATLAAYLNALEGLGVHVITVNDYLAKRDTQWMGPIYHALGLSVAVIQSNGGNPNRPSAYMLDPTFHDPSDPSMNFLVPVSRHAAYRADITHGTNNEFGFDYLRDNMARSAEEYVQRELHYAIVDEVDNILIDEARTPLIISGPAGKADDNYYKFADILRQLREGEDRDYTIKEKERVVNLTELGLERVERMLNIPPYESIYDDKWSKYTPYLDNALKAKALYQRDREYIVRDGQVIIVDEFTGRLMEGRRYEGGLHQAIEAKERVRIQQENLTYATITLQNYFRMYEKLSGMTGTAITESEEFYKIYGLDVVPIPTNKEMKRADENDMVFKSEKSKYEAVVEEIEEMYKIGRPVLVGTTSVEKSEVLANLLQRHKIPHNVLNAKLHEKEAAIVTQAGRPGAITIATNMAGRGTDIILGGSPDSYLQDELEKRGLKAEDIGSEIYSEAEEEAQKRWEEAHERVIAAGGLHIIGTERHESRRIDNQLRGRAGRQGDPGSTRFYISLEDELMRRFGSDRIKSLLERFNFEDDQPIDFGMVGRLVEQAQTKVEGMNFDFRKHLVEFDDVMNKQRESIYDDRHRILTSEDLREQISTLIKGRLDEIVEEHTHGDQHEWDLASLFRNLGLMLRSSAIKFDRQPHDEEDQKQMVLEALEKEFNISLHDFEGKNREGIDELVSEMLDHAYNEKLERLGEENMKLFERLVLVQVYDDNWVNYLTPLEELRRGIGLRAYGQRDPLQEYRRAAFQFWNELQVNIKRDIAEKFFAYELQRAAPPPPPMQTNAPEESADNGKAKPTPAKSKKTGPNEPCPCGSGKKYKKCHGAVAAMR